MSEFDIRNTDLKETEKEFERALRPLNFGDFQGQKKIVENLEIFVRAAKMRGESLDHVILHGPPGLGKTTLSAIIANELGVGIKITSGPVLDKPGDLAGLLTNLEENDVLFIDEIHRLSPVVEEYLYSAMEDYRIDIMIDKGPAARSVQIQINPFTLIGATTRSGLLTAPLRARFGINCHLEYYDTDILSGIISRSAAILNVGITGQAAMEIASRSRGTPRIANALLRRVRDFAMVKGNGSLHPTISIEGEQNGMEVDIALQFTSGYQETTLSFVNLVRTGDGGTHETGFKSGLTKTFNDYARKYGLLKEKDKNLEGNDVREGLSAIISIKVPEHYLQFEGQTKSKLGTPEARNIVDSIVYEKLSYFLEENKEIADNLVKKMIKAAQVRDAARKAREAARKGKGARQERILSGKLAPAQTKNKKKNELYLVEGDSAGGSAKQGRDRKYQAILPLRGKVLNSEKVSLQDILKNEELATLINTIGAGFGADFKVEDSHYDKVIIMTDADTDGAHIQILLLTFFYRYMKDLITAGKVYIALPPLYKVSKKSGKKEEVIYCWEDYELEDAKKKIGRGYNVQRYKGLGEMNASQLWETTMDPETRTLIQVSIDDAAVVERNVTVLMGDKVEPRREWIEQNVQFTLEDQI